MEGDVGRDTNKSLWVLGRYGYIAEDWKSLEQSSILWVPTIYSYGGIGIHTDLKSQGLE